MFQVRAGQPLGKRMQEAAAELLLLATELPV